MSNTEAIRAAIGRGKQQVAGGLEIGQTAAAIAEQVKDNLVKIRALMMIASVEVNQGLVTIDDVLEGTNSKENFTQIARKDKEEFWMGDGPDSASTHLGAAIAAMDGFLLSELDGSSGIMNPVNRAVEYGNQL